MNSTIKRITLFGLILLCCFHNSIAQEEKMDNEKLAFSETTINEIVNYYYETLNFLGDTNTVQRERDIAINDSYIKLFVDNNVQIEDDLAKVREVPVYKDVQAYLKDIHFFFSYCSFDYEIMEIDYFSDKPGFWTFLVTSNRTLYGTTYKNDTLLNSQLRYIEINYNENENDYKIASVYTTQLDKKIELMRWWSSLDEAWRNYFAGKTRVIDTTYNDTILFRNIVSFDDSYVIIKKDSIAVVAIQELQQDSAKLNNQEDTALGNTMAIQYIDSSNFSFVYDTISVVYYDTVAYNTSPFYTFVDNKLKTTSINITNQKKYLSLKPLSKLTKLEELYFSNTLIQDLSPIRNLGHLKTLNCANTEIDNISLISTCITLEELTIDSTNVSSIEAIKDLKKLKQFSLAAINLEDFTPIAELSNLEELDVSSTPLSSLSLLTTLKSLKELDISYSSISSLDSISALQQLSFLDASSTKVTDLTPLQQLDSLSILIINKTDVSTLMPLQHNKSLYFIYCQQTKIPTDSILSFLPKLPTCTVVYQADRLKTWWIGLSAEWKKFFMNKHGISLNPTIEELHQLLRIEKVDISDNKAITSLEPLTILPYIDCINAESSGIRDISHTSKLFQLKSISIAATAVTDLSPLANNKCLEEVNCENTTISTLQPLKNNKALHTIWANNTAIIKEDVYALKKALPSCTTVFNCDENKIWWNALNEEWKKALNWDENPSSTPSDYDLQLIINKDSVSVINNSNIFAIEVLTALPFLTHLTITNTTLSDLTPLAKITSLRSINIGNNPIIDISPLQYLTDLETLNIQNTPVTTLDALILLTKIKRLDISGTQVKSLKPISHFVGLEELTINNTRISSITPLNQILSLKKLEVYNTKLSIKKIEKFKLLNPNCQIIFY